MCICLLIVVVGPLCYDRLKEDLERRALLFCQEHFNARVGRSVDVDDVVRKDTRSASGIRLWFPFPVK